MYCGIGTTIAIPIYKVPCDTIKGADYITSIEYVEIYTCGNYIATDNE